MTVHTPAIHAGDDAVLEQVADKFIASSERRGTSTFARIRFPETLDSTRPVMPEKLVSLYGHPLYRELDDETRWRLGLLETVNFFSLNIHGEQALVAGLAERLYRERWSGETPRLSRYLQHFIHDENSHTYMLAEFCTRYYGRVMPEIVYHFENPSLSRTGADLLFFCRLFVFETFLDFLNRSAMRDDGLEETARSVHESHHLDESMHIAFDKVVLRVLVALMQDQGLETEIRAVGELTRRYADYAFSKLINPRIYRELGLPDPLSIARDIPKTKRWKRLKDQWMGNQSRFLTRLGVYAP